MMDERPLATTVAKRLREVRERRGLTQTAVVGRLAKVFGSGMDQTTYARIEKLKGGRRLNVDDVVRLAAVLNVSPIDLFVDRDTDAVPAEGPWVFLGGEASIPEAHFRAWLRGDGPLSLGEDLDDTAAEERRREFHAEHPPADQHRVAVQQDRAVQAVRGLLFAVEQDASDRLTGSRGWGPELLHEQLVRYRQAALRHVDALIEDLLDEIPADERSRRDAEAAGEEQ